MGQDFTRCLYGRTCFKRSPTVNGVQVPKIRDVTKNDI